MLLRIGKKIRFGIQIGRIWVVDMEASTPFLFFPFRQGTILRRKSPPNLTLSQQFTSHGTRSRLHPRPTSYSDSISGDGDTTIGTWAEWRRWQLKGWLRAPLLLYCTAWCFASSHHHSSPSLHTSSSPDVDGRMGFVGGLASAIHGPRGRGVLPSTIDTCAPLFLATHRIC